MIEKSKNTFIAQLVARGAIFILFFVGIFVSTPYFLLYLLLPLIAANLILGFINKRKSIIFNIIFLIIYPFLFIMIIDYIATIIGSLLGLIHFGLLFKEFMTPVKKESSKK